LKKNLKNSQTTFSPQFTINTPPIPPQKNQILERNKEKISQPLTYRNLCKKIKVKIDSPLHKFPFYILIPPDFIPPHPTLKRENLHISSQPYPLSLLFCFSTPILHEKEFTTIPLEEKKTTPQQEEKTQQNIIQTKRRSS
jgi:hypothetical protein